MSLALTRQPTETLYIGDDIRIHVYAVSNEKVKLAIDAPITLKIVRHELAPPALIEGFPKHDRPEFAPGYRKERGGKTKTRTQTQTTTETSSGEL